MTVIILVIHLFVAAALVGLVLVQRSEGGALGMGGGSNSLISGRGAADALARLTMVAGAIFFVTSISLTMIAGSARRNRSVIDQVPVSAPITAPIGVPAAAAPADAAASPDGEDVQRIPSAQQAVQRAGPLQTREDVPTPSAPAAAVSAPVPAARVPAAPFPARVGGQPLAGSPVRVEPAAPRRAAAPSPGVSTVTAPPSTPPPESVEPAPVAAPAPTIPRPRAGPEE